MLGFGEGAGLTTNLYLGMLEEAGRVESIAAASSSSTSQHRAFQDSLVLPRVFARSQSNYAHVYCRSFRKQRTSRKIGSELIPEPHSFSD